MKRKLLMVMCLTAALSLAACGSKAPVSEVESVNAAGTDQEPSFEMEAVKDTEMPLTDESVETETEVMTAGFEDKVVEGPVEDGTYEGIVMDAAMNSFSIYTEDGTTIFFGMPEDGSNLKNGMLLGIPVKVICKDGSVTEVTDGEKQPLAGREALEFAGSIMIAYRYRDMETLSSLISYPVSVNVDGEDGEVKDAEEFEKLDADKIFSEERRHAVLSADLYSMKELSGKKYVLGDEKGKPNVIFSVDEGNDRGFSITGIN